MDFADTRAHASMAEKEQRILQIVEEMQQLVMAENSNGH